MFDYSDGLIIRPTSKQRNTARRTLKRCLMKNTSRYLSLRLSMPRTTDTSVSWTSKTLQLETDQGSGHLLVPALKRGIKVLTEKPMTTDIEKCKAILRTVQETNNHLTVTFVSKPILS